MVTCSLWLVVGLTKVKTQEQVLAPADAEELEDGVQSLPNAPLLASTSTAADGFTESKMTLVIYSDEAELLAEPDAPLLPLEPELPLAEPPLKPVLSDFELRPFPLVHDADVITTAQSKATPKQFMLIRQLCAALFKRVLIL